ncbi:hypothetical protein DZG01_20185 [Pseudomonas fluorescens]|nr:hypothetical protein DZG01_20185 [Pseudomonas fluorescens]
MPKSSRAGSLPRWIFSGFEFHVQHRTPVGASLLAMAIAGASAKTPADTLRASRPGPGGTGW